MIEASDLRTGAFIKKNNEVFRVVEVETKAGPARFSSHVYVKLQNVKTGKTLEMKLTPEEKMEDVSIDILPLEYLYADGENFCFMNPQSYEQVEIPGYMLEDFREFLREGTSLKFEFYEGTPVGVLKPETVELKVISTGSGIRGETDTTYKSAILENNMEILVPQFIKPGDTVKVSTKTKQYVERIHK
ncbi:MAG: elongation factor P [Candidatus Omnitrophica bacterium]|nr:elongation factor P [Candidatus Omnitrophota bacterium]